MERTKIVELARLFRVLSSPLRLQILDFVHTAPSGLVTLAQLSEALEQHAPPLVPHLRSLVEVGVLHRHGQGRETYYSFDPSVLRQITQLPGLFDKPSVADDHGLEATPQGHSGATVAGAVVGRLTVDTPGRMEIIVAVRPPD